ncbi:hypothetical protein [Oceanihabitans sediminis]|uniref:Uncharacterized protein n=1 Tax=Oceanihabitans sediminis TaxID=1812012 RepID=A0A368P6T1_9FLAO|nr:hypothetical protein [Oceanihabitans sediminis]MDX1278384.1 hypothetical protein [Oceanihabitans sediminis]RBP34317.1 hypothetical protein DFR65_101205 [Oceanihabitans sediminis]RCU58000.1 hypothetical protein DU428_01020 [Oceanihabitans sediminis]
MKTKIPTPIVHVYKEFNIGKYKTVRHFELFECSKYPILSKHINISANRNYALSMPTYWLKIKEEKIWTDYITGLFKTKIPNVYKGDADRKKHLLLFKFSDNGETLNVYYFQNYYTNDLRHVLKHINTEH